MSVLLAALVVVSFAFAIERMSLPARAREVAERAATCVETVRDSSLGDDDKERILQSQALRLFMLMGILAGGSAVALLLPLLAIWSLELAGLASLGQVLSVLQRPDFLAATAVIGGIAYLLARRFLVR